MAKFKDWWWKVQLGKCYFRYKYSMYIFVKGLQCFYRLGLIRDAEKQFKSAMGHGQFVDIYLFLAKIYIKMDQPGTALQTLKKVLEILFIFYQLLLSPGHPLGVGEVSR